MSATTFARARVSAPARTARRRRIDGWRIGGVVFLVLLLLFSIMPMVWMLLTSVKTQFAALQYPPEWWPHAPTLSNYTRLLSPTSDVGQEFLTYLHIAPEEIRHIREWSRTGEGKH